ncbi:MAG: hypothetical protein K2U26_09850 [Cyclobacteriaceae bacterium]|nr:hypothetical protein [Cyclobacteriaceae bacterium]
MKLLFVLILSLTVNASLSAQTKSQSIEPINLKERAALTCKLTSKELQHRRKTVLADLKNQMLTKDEMGNGFEYTFSGTDAIIDQLSEFVKTERQCCDFFDYEIKITGDTKTAKLKITGPEGVKEFIKEELGL